MAKILAELLATVTALRSEVATLKSAAPVRRTSPAAPKGTRRVVGTWDKHPGGSMAFQNDALDWNQTPTAHLTDAQLCDWWNQEYSDAPTKALTVAMVGYVRTVHNEGLHGKSDTKPTTPCLEFKDSDAPKTTDPDPDPDARRD